MVTNNRKNCWQVLFLKTLQVETNSFGKALCQGNDIVSRGVLTRTTASERAGTSIGITSTIVHMQMKTTFQGDTKSDSMRKIAICSQADKKFILVE